MSARARILARVKNAAARLDPVGHPGAFEGWRPEAYDGDAVPGFAEMFSSAGGEVVRVDDADAARRWLAEFAAGFEAVAAGSTVPEALRAGTPAQTPDVAALGVSMARGAAAETGSLLLDSRDGRLAQLLPPTHVVVLQAEDVRLTLAQALDSLREDLPSALALHSGPSKSADIGQILVKGVHGPGRVIALLIG